MNLNEQVQSVILSNLRPVDNRLIGIEIECLVYNQKMQRVPVNPGPEFSATDLLEQLSRWKGDNQHCIHYSLEPGGQLEYASQPGNNLHIINQQYRQHLEQLIQISQQEKLVLIDYALEPLFGPEQVELIAEEKYRHMHDLFSGTGNHGHWMMRNTTSVQVNIDITSRRDAEEMAFIADCIEPFAAILFAHAPFYRGKVAGTRNLRYDIWNDTDPSRCGNLFDHGIDSPDGLLEKYIYWILSIPMIFALDQANHVISFRGTAGEWLRSRAVAGVATDEDIQLVLHQIFTHARFKHVLEVRGADRPLCGHDLAPAAFWVGLLTTANTRERILDLVNSWSHETRLKLNASAARLDLQQPAPDGRELGEWIGEITDLAQAGLDERADLCDIPNERKYLADYLTEFFRIGPPAIHIQNIYKRSTLPLAEFIKTCAMAYE